MRILLVVSLIGEPDAGTYNVELPIELSYMVDVSKMNRTTIWQYEVRCGPKKEDQSDVLKRDGSTCSETCEPIFGYIVTMIGGTDMSA